MENRKVKIKKKPNWKFWVLLAIVLALLAILISTFIFLDTISWVNMVILPTIISLVAGAGISLFFTVKTDRERLTDELQKEIEEVLERTMYLLRISSEVVQNPLNSTILKKQILTQEYATMPSMFRVRDCYRELWLLYKENRDKLITEISKIDNQCKYDELVSVYSTQYGPIIAMYIAEISDCALRVQEQFYQDFKGEPKKVIPDQLIHKVKPPQEQKPN